MKKATLITSIVLLAMAAVPASAETNTYLFHHAQSTVVQTGGIADINETHRIRGYFQLTADFDTGVASFDWVDATLSKRPFLYTQNLGELFNMTNLLGTFLNDTTIKFEGKTSDGTNADISLEVSLAGDSLQLTGQISSPCCDLFDYELDAVASKTYPGWTYHYLDDFNDFSTNQAKKDSYSHSIFWPKDAFPPPEPYLYYYGTGTGRALVFTGYLGQPAHLAYCFPIQPGPVPRTVRGVLQLDVSFPSNADISQSPPGYLLYSCSSDGQNWSTPEQLYQGHNHIHLESVQGTCYIIFLGTSAAIDNLEVHLHSHPTTIYVPADFPTIQDAIDDANDGDVIEVATGTYEGTGNRDIEFRGKAITVRSANGPEQTIIDCSGPGGEQHRGFYFHEAEKSDSVLRGFTIRGGRIHGSEIPTDDEQWTRDPNHPIGAGIYCEFSSPTIVNCVVKNCRTEIGAGIGCVGGEPAIIDCLIENCTAGGGPAESGGRGGGIGLIRSTNAKIKNCIIKNNTIHQDGRGGGIYVRRAGAVIKNCDISFNGPKSENSFMLGGGLYCADPQTRVLLKNCIISHNWAAAGAAIFSSEREPNIPDCTDAICPPCNVRVTNCTVAHNKLVAGPWMWPAVYAAIQSSENDIVVKNSIVWYNEGLQIAPNDVPVLYCDVQGGYLTGTGNIDVPPLFAPNDVPDYDYHLQSRYGRYDPQTSQWVIDANHSPCIDAGDPNDPVGHEPTPNGKRVNMGAYGGTRQASKGKRLVYHVDAINGSDANDGLSKKTAFATIQKGIDSTKDGDAVMVWPGVYIEEVIFDGKAITVQSAADAPVVEAPSGYAFSFFAGERNDSVLRNFVITNCQEGAAIFCENASPTLTNLTIARNAYGIVAYEDADPNISNCILWDNTFGDLSEECRARYSCIQNPNPGQHWSNISEDPLFADPNKDDYHLRSSFGRYEPGPEPNWVIDDVNSPCIDAADPNVHPRRERMPNGGRLNMGAYGGTPYASMSKWLLRGDINHDGLVNLKDLAIIARKRMLRSDANNDGLINMKDIAFAAHRWLDFLPWAPPELAETDIVCPISGEKIPTPRRHQNRH